jgi:hypothetical protein
MELESVGAFVEQWVDAWNRHDLDAIMSHFAEDVVFTSPLAARIVDGSDGVVRGWEALRAYWAEGLRISPDLHFEIIATYVGINAIVINYRNQNGRMTNEVLVFDGPLVVSGHGTYLSTVDSGAGQG